MQRDQELHVQTEESKRARPADPSPAQRLGEGIARGAAVVASLTILSRILGLVRTLVFSQTVGASCLGTAYVTANQVPDLLYQLILTRRRALEVFGKLRRPVPSRAMCGGAVSQDSARRHR